ncbi:hypothetical protein LT493_12835 [Streptomyces tricolor]|nr:hypothetical protein [Streptomyces tricolor]
MADLPQVFGGDPAPPGTALWRAVYLVSALTQPDLLELLKDQAKAIKGGKRMSMKGFGELLGPIIDLPWRAQKKLMTKQARNAWNNGGVLSNDVARAWTPVPTDDFTTLIEPAMKGDYDARRTLAVAGGVALIADKLLTRNVGSSLGVKREKGGGAVPVRRPQGHRGTVPSDERTRAVDARAGRQHLPQRRPAAELRTEAEPHRQGRRPRPTSRPTSIFEGGPRGRGPHRPGRRGRARAAVRVGRRGGLGPGPGDHRSWCRRRPSPRRRSTSRRRPRWAASRAPAEGSPLRRRSRLRGARPPAPHPVPPVPGADPVTTLFHYGAVPGPRSHDPAVPPSQRAAGHREPSTSGCRGPGTRWTICTPWARGRGQHSDRPRGTARRVARPPGRHPDGRGEPRRRTTGAMRTPRREDGDPEAEEALELAQD